AEGEQRTPGISELCGKLAAQRIVVLSASMTAVVNILERAFVAGSFESQAALHVGSDRPGNGPIEIKLPELPARPGQVTLKVLGRLVCHILDRAAGGIAAEQSPLRATQHLHTLQVEHREAGEIEAARVGVVVVHRDWRLLLISEVIL